MGQSPIDLHEASAERLPPVTFAYRSSHVTLTNTGSPDRAATVRAVPVETCTVSVADESYRLREVHWHTPAEHVIEVVAPLEMHLVHENDHGDIVVVGFLFEVGAPNLELDRVFNRLPTSGQSAEVGDIDLAGLVRPFRCSYRYEGSLTTPPFTEGVAWIVARTRLSASSRQMDLFASQFPDGNARPIQPRDGHVVLSDCVV